MIRKQHPTFVAAGVFALLLVTTAFGSPAAADESLADFALGANQASWAPADAGLGLVLTISGPDGYVHREEFAAGDAPSFGLIDRQGNALADGTYNWELSALVTVDAATNAQMKSARESGLALRSAVGSIPAQSGAFTVAGGSFLAQDVEEPNVGPAPTTGPTLATKDFVILDDLIVDGSACIGFDCVNGEVFGFDTIRLKENNLRIKFEDTSGGSFPTNDWQLTANDSASGGLSKFSIDDITNNRTPFTVEARAPSHSLYVDDGGRIGLGTSIPVADLHIKDGDSPTLRLEQDGSSGFAPQTWDIAGNETSFFIRDATNGSTLPLRIRPGAPSQSLVIDTDGDIGVGTLTADEALHVFSSAATADKIYVENTNGTVSERELLLLENNGPPAFSLDNGASGDAWKFSVQPAGFQVTRQGSGVAEFFVTDAGEVQAQGAFVTVSDRNAKQMITPVDPGEVLQRVLDLPVATWAYKNDDPWVRHMGPMAQDFSAAFQLGRNATTISSLDVASVSVAAIQGLANQISEQAATIDQLEVENQRLVEALESRDAEIAQRLAEIEARLSATSEASAKTDE